MWRKGGIQEQNKFSGKKAKEMKGRCCITIAKR